MIEETTFWKGSPSQWINIGPFTFAILLTAAIIAGAIFSGPAAPFILIGLAIPLIYAVWSYLTVRCKVYELTTQRLRISTGVINQDIDEIELYRVKDILVERKWWMRLTGLGTVHLENIRPLPTSIGYHRRSGFHQAPRGTPQTCRSHARQQTRPRNGFRRNRR